VITPELGKRARQVCPTLLTQSGVGDREGQC